MQFIPTTIRSLLLGAMMTLGGALLVIVFAESFRSGATWSPVTQRGGPGFLFVILPALAGWFWLADMVTHRGLSALWQALSISIVPAIVAVLGGIALAQKWATAPAVVGSLFSTIAVALIVGTLASVSVRLAQDPIQE